MQPRFFLSQSLREIASFVGSPSPRETRESRLGVLGQDLRAQYDAGAAAPAPASAASASATPRGQLAAEANVVPGSGLAWENGATCVGVVVKWGSQYFFGMYHIDCMCFLGYLFILKVF